VLRRDDDGAPTSVGIFNSRGSWFPREKRFTAEPQSSRRDAKEERVSEAGGRSFGGNGGYGALTSVGIFDSRSSQFRREEVYR
jgi:hypothetical protein